MRDPILTFPICNGSYIGDSLAIKWDYSGEQSRQGYLFEYVKMGNSVSSVNHIYIPNLENKELILKLNSSADYGSYICRLTPGTKIDSETGISLVNTNPRAGKYICSRISPSLKDRIVMNKRIRVGVSPSVYGKLINIDERGEIVGFEPWLIENIVGYIKSELDLESINIEYAVYDWNELLNNVMDTELDLAISSISMTKERTRKGIVFSDPYHRNMQVLIKRADNIIEARDLRNRPVGVLDSGTNYETAIALREVLRYNQPEKYNSYGMLIEDVRLGKVDAALVDYSIVGGQLENNNLNVINYRLDNQNVVQNLYARLFVRNADTYGIATAAKARGDDIMNMINRWIRENAQVINDKKGEMGILSRPNGW